MTENIENIDFLNNIQFSNLTDNQKKLFLKLLGCYVDEENFIVQNGKRVECPYSHELVDFNSASILPGSTVIIKTSPYTLSRYISEHLAGEVILDSRN